MKFEDLLEPNWPLSTEQQGRLVWLIMEVRRKVDDLLANLTPGMSDYEVSVYTLDIDMSGLWRSMLLPPMFREEVRRHHHSFYDVTNNHERPHWWWSKERKSTTLASYKVLLKWWLEETKQWLDSIELNAADAT